MFTLTNFIAGWLGGIASLLVGHPWDTAKVRQQVLRTTLSNAIRLTIKFEGIRGLYKGISFPMMLIGPSNAVFFGIYGNFMRNYYNTLTVHTPHHVESWASHVFVGGCVAGVGQLVINTPMELVKTIMQVETKNGFTNWEKKNGPPAKEIRKKRFGGMFHILAKIYKEDGARGYFKGFVPLFIRDVPTSGLYMLTYEYMVDLDYFGLISNSLIKQCLAGGSAGITSWMLVIPFDVVKARMQADDPLSPKYKGMIDCMVKSYRADGMKLFTKGMTAVFVRAFPSNAALFVVYEQTLNLFELIS